MLGLGFRTNFLGTRVCACRDNVKVIVDQEVLLERRGSGTIVVWIIELKGVQGS